MGEVALVYQPRVEEALPLARVCASAISRRGRSVSIISTGDLVSSPPVVGPDLVVTFGGDGTILQAARWIAGGAVPVIGIQMGRLGFLAELLPDALPEALDPYLERDYWEDRRVMLAATLAINGHETSPHGNESRWLALNDVVVARGASPRTVTIDLLLNQSLLRSFRCDGVIVATATGSTAYSFAAGGPVLAPDAADVAVTVICPHNSDLHSLVLPGDSSLQLQVWATQPAIVSIDGQVDVELENGALVQVGPSERATTFARRGSRADFYRRVLAKLH